MAIITINAGENIRVKAATANPGDIIEISPGTYSIEQVYLSPVTGCSSGTANSPITIRAKDPNNKPIISSANKHPNMLGNTQFVIENLNYWHIENIKIENFQNAGFLILAEGTTVTGVIADGIEIRNQTQNINANRSSHSGVGVHTVGVFTRPADTVARVENCIIRNFYIENVRSGEPQAYNEVCTIGGRTFNILVENNTIKNSGYGIAFNNLGWGDVNVCGPGATDWRCYWKAAQPTGTIFRRNTVINFLNSNFSGTAFYNDRGLSATWEENFCIGTKSGFVVSHEPGWVVNTVKPEGPFIIRNNVAICGNVVEGGLSYGGAALILALGSNMPEVYRINNIEVYNNIFIIRNPSAYSAFIKWQRVENAKVHNNVFWEDSAPYGADVMSYATVDDFGVPYTGTNGPQDSAWQIYCNTYFSDAVDINVSRAFTWPSTGTKIGLNSWKAAGKDANSIKQLPTFVNPNITDVDGFILTNDPGLNCGKIGINITPQVSINASFIYVKNGLSVNFTNTSTATNGISTYAWNFGDNSTSSVQNPVHTYSSTGTYPVTLTVTGPDGSSTVTQSVVVVSNVLTFDPCDTNILLNGDFSTNDYSNWVTYSNALGGSTNPCDNNIITNGDFASGNLTGWFFVSGGASTAGVVNNQVQITVNGPTTTTQLSQNGLSLTSGQQYTLRFDAKTTSGTNNFESSIILDESPYSNLGSGYNVANLTTTMQTFEYTFTANASTTNARLRLYFLASTSGTIVIDNICLGQTSASSGDTFSASTGKSVATLIGSGTNVQLFQNQLSLVSGQHYGVTFDYSGTLNEEFVAEIILDESPYSNLGFFDVVTLDSNTQTYTGSFVATQTTNIGRLRFGFVGTTGTVNIDNVCLGPVVESEINASFTFTPLTADENVLITFTNTSTSTNDIDTYAWDFGDESVGSTVENPTHTYTSPGTYTITLTITGIDGTSTATQEIIITDVEEPIVPIISVNGKFSVDTYGNVKLLSTTTAWIDLFGQNINKLGIIIVSYNIFTGLGVAIEPVSQQVLYFNIDTGGYSLETYSNTVVATGQDNRLKYGTLHPIQNGVSRNEAYWNWYQTQQNTNFGTSVKPWPTLFANQRTKYLTIASN